MSRSPCRILEWQWLLIVCSIVSSKPLYDVTKIKISNDLGSLGNGLITTSKILKNEVIMSIPLEMCITSHRCGAVRGLSGQTDFAFEYFGDLRSCIDENEEIKGRTWDVNLALGLLMATNDESLAANSAFWDSYRSFFPSYDSLTVPFCLPQNLLRELQDQELEQNVMKQQQRLINLFPSLDPGFHTALSWAFAMVRSRCFQLTSDWFAMVPVIDIANHDPEPCSQFEFTGIDITMDSDELPNNGLCVLKALRDIESGESVTIRYDSKDDSYSNERLMVQYGFIIPNNPYLAPSLFDSPSNDSNQPVKSTNNPNSAENTLQELSNEVTDALIDSVIQIQVELQQEFDNTEPIIKNLEYLSPLIGIQLRKHFNNNIDTFYHHIQNIINQFPTSLSDDYKSLHDIDDYLLQVTTNTNEMSEINEKQRLKACLLYRIDKKEKLKLASKILEYAINKLKV